MNPGGGGPRFRRRALLNKDAGARWQLICSAVAAFPIPVCASHPEELRHYPAALLYEDWLDRDGVHAFLQEMRAGAPTFRDVTVERKANLSWQLEQVPLKNIHMQRWRIGRRP